MTEMHVPAHITMTRRIAQQEAATVTALTVEEQQLKTEYDKHQAEYEAERARLDAELRDAAEKAKQHLDRLAAAGQKLSSSITDVGRRLRQHSDEATDAQQTVLDWCTRRGINVTDLPPLRDTGPMPAIAAPTAPEMPDRCDECETTGRNCTAHGGRPGIPYTPPAAPKLPAIEEPDGLLEAGRRAANPNTDPGATRVDAGGDQPDPSGPFPGGVESPAGPRPKRPRRRPQSDRVNEQDGDDRG